MIENREKVSRAVFAAIEELNKLLPEENCLEKSMDTLLLGGSGKLDSLGFVNLIALIEEKCEEELGVNIILTNNRATSQEGNPFRTIGSLVDHISLLLEGKNK